MTTVEPALTGTVSIESIETLLARIQRVDKMLEDLAEARFNLQHVVDRPLQETWSPLPSLTLFAGSYINASATTVAIIDQAEVKVSGMVAAMRAFLTDFQHQDQAALDALAALERRVEAALAPPPLPAPGRVYDAHPGIDPGLHQRAV